MKNILLAVVFVFIANVAFAATSPSVTGDAKAEIIAPVTVTHVTGSYLNFGRIASGPSGSVTVPAEATPTAQYNTVQRADGGDAVSSDHFTVTHGTSNYSFVISDDSITLNGPNSATMTVGSFTHSCANPCADDDVYVGGTLTVGSSQTAGTYTGQYNVNVTY